MSNAIYLGNLFDVSDASERIEVRRHRKRQRVSRKRKQRRWQWSGRR